MRALVIDKDPRRLVATKVLSALTPRAFVGALAPLQLREIPAPALSAPDSAVDLPRAGPARRRQVPFDRF